MRSGSGSREPRRRRRGSFSRGGFGAPKSLDRSGLPGAPSSPGCGWCAAATGSWPGSAARVTTAPMSASPAARQRWSDDRAPRMAPRRQIRQLAAARVGVSTSSFPCADGNENRQHLRLACADGIGPGDAPTLPHARQHPPTLVGRASARGPSPDFSSRCPYLGARLTIGCLGIVPDVMPGLIPSIGSATDNQSLRGGGRSRRRLGVL